MTNDYPSLKLLSPAKLNLFLHITGRRSDGYHNLQTLFQLLDYGDILEFRTRPDQQITLQPQLPGLSFDDNLVVKAARLLQPHNLTNKGVDIVLAKHLPMGGGIGGGSSNAATTLVALNQLWDCGLTRSQLKHLGLKLGADVPVFVGAQSAWAEGVGETLEPLELPERWFLVVQPNCQISTAEIFSHKDLTRDTPPIKVAAFLERGGRNDCQALVRKLYSQVDEALRWLEKFSHNAQMTGTGACVFSAFETAADAQQVQANLPPNLRSFIARGVNQSPLYNFLPVV